MYWIFFLNYPNLMRIDFTVLKTVVSFLFTCMFYEGLLRWMKAYLMSAGHTDKTSINTHLEELKATQKGIFLLKNLFCRNVNIKTRP